MGIFILTILSGLHALCDHVCLPVKEICFPVLHVEAYYSCWRCLLTVNGERHWEMFYARSSCLRNAHPCASRQKPPRTLSREDSRKSFPWWCRDFFFFKLLKKYREPLLGFPVRSLFLWSIFGIIWQCGLSDVWFWMGFWMWEVVTFWKRHSSIGQQTQVTSWESIWYDW